MLNCYIREESFTQNTDLPVLISRNCTTHCSFFDLTFIFIIDHHCISFYIISSSLLFLPELLFNCIHVSIYNFNCIYSLQGYFIFFRLEFIICLIWIIDKGEQHLYSFHICQIDLSCIFFFFRKYYQMHTLVLIL